MFELLSKIDYPKISSNFHSYFLRHSNPGAVNEARGIASPLHSQPEFRIKPDLSKYLILTDSSTCLSRAFMKLFVASIIGYGQTIRSCTDAQAIEMFFSSNQYTYFFLTHHGK